MAALLSGAFLAAVVGAVVSVWLARRKSLEEERARIRATYAEAFEAYTAYKEFPYAIRRRRQDQPAEERVRLSEELRQVQARLSYYLAWTKAESTEVGQAYERLVAAARRIAGAAMREAWTAAPVDTDSGMNIPPEVVDLSALQPDEEAYIAAAQRHLRALRSWVRLFRPG